MMLTSLCEHERKEQHHGANDAGETACRERGCRALCPCPEERERSHAAGVLCHHKLQSSVCSIPAPHLCKARDPGRGDAGSHEAFSMTQTAEPVYGPAVVEGLIWLYHLSGELCGKRLQAAIPKLLRAPERSGTTLPDKVQEPPCPHPWWSPSGTSRLHPPGTWRWTP